MTTTPRRSGLVAVAILGVELVARAAGAASAPVPWVGPFTRDDYPRAVIDRPLTLPAGMVEGEVGVGFSSIGVGAPQAFAVDDWNADVTLRVGVTDRLQIEAGTSFSLDHAVHGGAFPGVDLRPSPTSWQRVVPVRLSFLALDTETLDTALALTLPFTAHASRTVTFGGETFRVANGDGRVLPFVALEAPTRWRLTDWLWLRAGEDLFAVTTGDGVAAFQFPLGLGVQPHPIFAVTLDSRIAAVVFDGSGELASRTLADVGTINLEGTLALLPALDVVGSLDLDDVGRGFDEYRTRLAVRVRL
jgi:hypothetical protein